MRRARSADRDEPLLVLEGLRVRFTDAGGAVHAVNGVDLVVEEGTRVAIVGESGCGKTVTSLAVVGLLPDGAQVTGSIRYRGAELVADGSRDQRRSLASLRGREIAMIFQDPMTSLNPVLTIGRQLTEALLAHVTTDAKDARRRAADLLDQVGLPDPARQLRAYPHQLSGGMRQRVMIAIALAGEPSLLIADEPTTALDVTIQAQILELLTTVVAERGMALLLITHDLGVVAGVCSTAHVLYAGRVVERGPVTGLFAAPAHHYTRGLIDSIPSPAVARKSRLQPIGGRPPRLRTAPDACAFAPRCPAAQADCRAAPPPLLPMRGPGHDAACLHPAGSQESVA